MKQADPINNRKTLRALRISLCWRRYQTRQRCIQTTVLTTPTRLRLQAMLRRLAAGQPVNLKERIELQKFADRDPTVAAWLRRARRRQTERLGGTTADPLLGDLDLDPSEPHSAFHPDHDDLGDWFSGAPDWLRRS